MTANHEGPGPRAAAPTPVPDAAPAPASAAASASAAGLAASVGVGADPSPGPVDVEELGRAVKEAQYRHHRTLDTRLASVGTTLAQWDALRAISRTPGASAHELAVATFQGDQAFGTLASRLAAQHLIERRPGRGRRIEHQLTEAGEHVLTAGRAVTREVLAASFGPLDEGERATLLGLLRRLGSPGEAL